MTSYARRGHPMFEIRGLDDAIRKLNRLQENTQRLAGSHDTKVFELFTLAFMRRYTKVASWDALIEASGFKLESQADFEAIPDKDWEKVIRTHTSFSSWREMMETGAADYAKKQLIEGV